MFRHDGAINQKLAPNYSNKMANPMKTHATDTSFGNQTFYQTNRSNSKELTDTQYCEKVKSSIEGRTKSFEPLPMLKTGIQKSHKAFLIENPRKTNIEVEP